VFNKLRNRFLLLNLVIISLMMLVAFAAIYSITYRDVRNDIDMELHRIADFYNKPGGGREPSKPFGEALQGDMNHHPSVSFMISTDRNWSMVSVSSRFYMDETFYEEAVRAASQQPRRGQVSLDGNDWAFFVQETPGGYRIVYLDVTAQQGILTDLIYTFLAVGLLMLIVIFFISYFFANRSIAPVKEAFEKQKQFIADASHELKTPLAVIQTNTDVLLANEEEPIRNQSKWLHYIRSETERMAKLTGDLLYLTQMDDAKENVIHTPFNLSDTVESVLLTMEAVIFEKQIALDYTIEPGLMTRGSAEQMKQVVMILLDNAIKYTNGSITLKLSRQHHEAVLEVTNTGEGIAPEHLEKIFDRFYRTDKSRTRKYGGYGLGLAIAKSIVQQHKGKIYARSVLGQHATFVVHLPLAP